MEEDGYFGTPGLIILERRMAGKGLLGYQRGGCIFLGISSLEDGSFNHSSSSISSKVYQT